LTDFVAIDFETADHDADSACAVGLVRVREGKIIEEASRLIRPPRQRIVFTEIHGLTWRRLKGEPAFGQVWPELIPLLDGASCLVAHNAPFDRGVLLACCGAAGIDPPALPFACTVRLARRAWGVYPTKLPDVCRHLAIRLKHHDPLSDARAAAQIAIAAMADGEALLA
jgi:DNA polymerase-3 subunit epsilon